MKKRVIAAVLSALIVFSSVMPVCAAEAVEATDQLSGIVIDDFVMDELVGAGETLQVGSGAKDESTPVMTLGVNYYDELPSISTGNTARYHYFKTKDTTEYWYYITVSNGGETAIRFDIVSENEKRELGENGLQIDGGKSVSFYKRLDENTKYYLSGAYYSDGAKTTGQKYYFSVRALDDAEPETQDEAKKIDINSIVAGSICAKRTSELYAYDGDTDWLKFTTGEAGQYILKTQDGGKNIQIAVYGPGNEVILDSYTSEYVTTGANLSLSGYTTYYAKLIGDPGTYKFGVFDAKHANTGNVTDVYKDVKAGAFYIDAISYMYSHNIMNGYDGKKKFGVDDPLRREDFATILYRASGSPEVDFKAQFSDVPYGKYYTNAVQWCADNGIVTGYSGSTKFGTGDSITREQLAAMIYRYAKLNGKDMNVKADITKYNDQAKIHDYAKEPFAWCVGNGVINGRTAKSGKPYLAPAGNATRAECATMLYRYLTK